MFITYFFFFLKCETNQWKKSSFVCNVISTITHQNIPFLFCVCKMAAALYCDYGPSLFTETSTELYCVITGKCLNSFSLLMLKGYYGALAIIICTIYLYACVMSFTYLLNVQGVP